MFIITNFSVSNKLSSLLRTDLNHRTVRFSNLSLEYLIKGLQKKLDIIEKQNFEYREELNQIHKKHNYEVDKLNTAISRLISEKEELHDKIKDRDFQLLALKKGTTFSIYLARFNGRRRLLNNLKNQAKPCRNGCQSKLYAD